MITCLDSSSIYLLKNFVDTVSLVCLECDRHYLNDWVGLVMRIITEKKKKAREVHSVCNRHPCRA